MVKKYFRPFLCAAMATMSVLSGCGSAASVCVMAAETETEAAAEVVTEAATEKPAEEQAEGQKPEQTETPTEAVTEAQTETATEIPAEAQTEAPATEAAEEQAALAEVQEAKNDENQTAVQTDEEQAEEADKEEPGADKADEKKGASDPKVSYEIDGNHVTAKISGISDDKAKTAVITYEIPDGLSFEKVKAPQLSGASVSVQYKAPDGSWKDYSDSVAKDNVKSIRFTVKAEDEEKGIAQENAEKEFALDFSASKSVAASTKTEVSYDENGSVVEKKVSKDLSITVETVSTPKLAYDKESYTKGDKILATISNVESDTASSCMVTYTIPKGAVFDTVANAPAFKNAGVALQYKGADGVWKDYTADVKSADVLAIRYKAVTASKGLVPDNEGFTVSMTAVSNANTATSVTAAYDENGTTTEKTASADMVISFEAVEVSMNQTPEMPTVADEIRQNVAASYHDSVDSKIVYNVADALDVSSIEVGSNTYLEGGKAVITSAAGETEIPITAVMDLSSYKGITKITFIPKIKSYDGMKANFTAVMSLKEEAAGLDAKDPVQEFTCSVDVVTGSGDAENTISAELTSKVAFSSLADPSVSLDYDGKEIKFGDEFKLVLGGMEMKAYGKVDSYFYTVNVPEYVTAKTLVLPNLKGAGKITVYAVIDGEEKNLGEFAPADTVDIGKKGVSEIRLDIQTNDSTLICTKTGVLTLSNDRKENKDGGTQNASIRCSVVGTIGGAEYKKSSSILSFNVKNYKRTSDEVITDPKPDHTPSPAPAPNPGPTEEEKQKEKEEEAKQDEERKNAEDARKEAIKKEALRNEQELKEKQKSILAGRVSQIRGKSLSSNGATSTNTSGKKTASANEKYASWNVPPIDESLVSDLIPKEIAPIAESLVENLLLPTDLTDNDNGTKTDASDFITDVQLQEPALETETEK